MKYLTNDMNYSIFKHATVNKLRFGVFKHGKYCRYVNLDDKKDIIKNDVLYDDEFNTEGEYLFIDKPYNHGDY